MKFTKHLPAFTFACALGFAPAAFAQTSTGGTMAPMPNSTMAPAATVPAAPAATPTTPAAPAMKPATKAVTPLAKTSEFKTEAAATAHCPGDTVVWSTLSKSKSYHLSSSKLYGKTKHGAYVCKADADAAGYHQAKN
ncbi:hypothetical protein [Acidocella aromatica]|uniref:Uncharacterized protein n=1 Tax=Acidocella aromatica TaxID=1303579 RepID=A0A840VPY2_9PROT|nr:hypothetical protein [Acidocella aromatica]MBB5373661.1 hypothetical protein [Acidocella aromatica]